MAFTDLSTDEQLDQVSEALQALLGDNPSKMDYLMLCQAAHAIVESLEVAIVERPLPAWGATSDVACAA